MTNNQIATIATCYNCYNCYNATSLYNIHLTFPFPTSLKTKFPIPFVISQIYRNFAAWWSAARRASNPYANHPAMTNIPCCLTLTDE